MNNDVMFSSEVDVWSTPQDLFDKLDKEFHFTLDVCADRSNHKCKNYAFKYFSISQLFKLGRLSFTYVRSVITYKITYRRDKIRPV